MTVYMFVVCGYEQCAQMVTIIVYVEI